MVLVKFQVLQADDSIDWAPKYATPGSAGADLKAFLTDKNTMLRIRPGQRALVKTNIAIELPAFYEAQVRPRSGLALKKGLTVLNTPGTIDTDYRGEIGVILCNTSETSQYIHHGDRIAQLVIAPITVAGFYEGRVDEKTLRGAGGFGSTGQ